AAVAQETETLVTLALAVPLPLVTVQSCVGLLGWVLTVTAYAVPLATDVANVNVPLAVTERLSLPLSCKTRPEPVSPVTEPPIVAVFPLLAPELAPVWLTPLHATSRKPTTNRVRPFRIFVPYFMGSFAPCPWPP